MSGGIAAAKAEHAAQGKWSGGPRPFGYEPAGGGLRIRESEAAYIRAAAQAVLTGSSTAAIAKRWNAAGLAGSAGGEWTGAKVQRLLLRPRYAGLNVHLGCETGPGQWPAILNMETFRSLQSALAGPKRTGPEYKWLGSGLYQCGTCHGPLTTHHAGSRGRPRATYHCPGHLARSAVPVDEWIGDLICARLTTVDLPARTQLWVPPDVINLREQVSTLRGRLDDLARLHQRGAIDGRQLVVGTEQSRGDIADLEARIRKASTPPDPGPRRTIGECWANLEMARKRVIVAEQFEWVRIMPTRLGKPAGHKRGEPYFDRDAITYQWR